MAVVGGMHDCDSSCCSTADKELPTRPAAPLLLTYPPWDTAAQGSNGTQSSHNSTGGSNLSPAETVQATRSSTYQSDPSAAAGAGAGAAADAGPQPEPCIPVPSGHDLVGSDKVASTFKAPPSHQPALCWLPGPLPVAAGDIYPLVASHNTVRSDGISVESPNRGRFYGRKDAGVAVIWNPFLPMLIGLCCMGRCTETSPRMLLSDTKGMTKDQPNYHLMIILCCYTGACSPSRRRTTPSCISRSHPSHTATLPW